MRPALPAVEYALLMAFIAVAIAGSVRTFGTAVADLFRHAVAIVPALDWTRRLSGFEPEVQPIPSSPERPTFPGPHPGDCR